MSVDLLNTMHDIEGLDPISCWPLAIGWWLIIGSGILLIIAVVYFYYRNKIYKNSWQYFAYKNLVNLETSVEIKTAKHVVTELSLSLRQIAVQKYPREGCASVFGIDWLVWLTAHDPKQFDWVKHGNVLLLGPYVPDLQAIDNASLKKLIQAAKRWVK